MVDANIHLNMMLFARFAISAAAAMAVAHWPNYEQDGSTALIVANEKGHADCVRQLLDAGADKDAANNVRVFFVHVSAVFAFKFCV